MEPDVNELKTKDFYGASCLKALGYRLSRVERSEHDFLLFVFHDPDYTAETELMDYFDGRVTCNAKALTEAIRDLKSLVHHKNY